MGINIDDLTIGQAKELARLFSGETHNVLPPAPLHPVVGARCIIRTETAGVWFGLVAQKDGDEVIVLDARRLWRWWAAEGISLSAVAIYGIKHDKSRIAEAVQTVWLRAIELIPCSDAATLSIESAENAKAE